MQPRPVIASRRPRARSGVEAARFRGHVEPRSGLREGRDHPRPALIPAVPRRSARPNRGFSLRQRPPSAFLRRLQGFVGGAMKVAKLLGALLAGAFLGAGAWALAQPGDSTSRYPYDPACPWGRISNGRGMIVRCINRQEAEQLFARSSAPSGSAAASGAPATSAGAAPASSAVPTAPDSRANGFGRTGPGRRGKAAACRKKAGGAAGSLRGVRREGRRPLRPER